MLAFWWVVLVSEDISYVKICRLLYYFYLHLNTIMCTLLYDNALTGQSTVLSVNAYCYRHFSLNRWAEQLFVRCILGKLPSGTRNHQTCKSCCVFDLFDSVQQFSQYNSSNLFVCKIKSCKNLYRLRALAYGGTMAEVFSLDTMRLAMNMLFIHIP